MIPELLTIEAAAERLGVSVKGLRAVAVREGFIVRIGRKPLIDAATLGELVEACRDQPRESGSHAEAARAIGKSGTARRASRPARLIEDQLTKR